jgi:hypothetical protein
MPINQYKGQSQWRHYRSSTPFCASVPLSCLGHQFAPYTYFLVFLTLFALLYVPCWTGNSLHGPSVQQSCHRNEAWYVGTCRAALPAALSTGRVSTLNLSLFVLQAHVEHLKLRPVKYRVGAGGAAERDYYHPEVNPTTVRFVFGNLMMGRCRMARIFLGSLQSPAPRELSPAMLTLLGNLPFTIFNATKHHRKVGIHPLPLLHLWGTSPRTPPPHPSGICSPIFAAPHCRLHSTSRGNHVTTQRHDPLTRYAMATVQPYNPR